LSNQPEVTITAEAVTYIERLVADDDHSIDWFATIQWRKGAADNRRGSDGSVSWKIEPDEGWVVELGGWETGKVPHDEGEPLCGSVRVLVQNFLAPQPFPGGEIYLDGNKLRLRPRAT